MTYWDMLPAILFVKCGQRNEREQFAHVHVDDIQELTRKGSVLVDLLLEDKCQRTDNDTLTVREILPASPVECFYGYDEKREKVMVEHSLRDLVSDDGAFLHPYLYDYSRHLIHTEESDEVLEKSKVKFDPNAHQKEKNPKNIDCIRGANKERDDAFMLNITMDLWLR